ncbi:hypothetical protein N9V96_01515 [Polaribacter sp.]|nr:hypothetical protein [Polaribacter sp.]
MRFYNFISVILHPMVIPTIGVLLYFFAIPSPLLQDQKFAVLCLVFAGTYLIPLCMLFLFKKLKFIDSYKANTIKERKVPVAIMIVLFYLLGNTFSNVPNLRDLSFLFYGTSLGLFSIYILFLFKFKTSIHLLSLGIATSFFIILNNQHAFNFIWIVVICFMLSGVLGSARLHLKAHTSKEVYLGYFLGFLSPVVLFYML